MEDEILDLESHKQVNNDEQIIEIVTRVINNYPDSVRDYKNGKDNAIKFLMGMCMKESSGRLNPKMVMDILQDFLNK